MRGEEMVRKGGEEEGRIELMDKMRTYDRKALSVPFKENEKHCSCRGMWFVVIVPH